MIYQVKSISNKFKSFEISDDGLGYLLFNIYEKIADQRWGGLEKIIGYHGKDKDIRVRYKGASNWMKFKNKRQSSESYLVPA